MTAENGRITVSEDTLRRVLAEFKLELVHELQQYARQETVSALETRLGIIERDGSIGTRDELKDHELRIRGLESNSWKTHGALLLIAFLLPLLAAISWHIWA